MELTLNLPRNYVEIEEEEMIYLDGGARYYNMNQALLSFLPGFVGSIYSCANALKGAIVSTAVAMFKIIARYMSAVTTAISTLWCGVQLFAAFTYLNRFGSYTMDSIKVFGLDTGIGYVGK